MRTTTLIRDHTTDPSADSDEPPGSPSPLARTIRELSDRLLAVGRPLRVLEALRWPDHVERAFLASRGRALPRVDRHTYDAAPLPFDPATAHAQLIALTGDVQRRLGGHPAGELLARRCRQLHDAVELVAARGTPAFAGLSRQVYGSSRDPLPAGAPTLAALAARVGAAAAGLEDCPELAREDRPLDARAAAAWLAGRLDEHFADGPPVRVIVCPAMAADAAVCGTVLKVRDGAAFSPRELRLLEAHEGWAHLGTTRNGLAQPVCTFLRRATPAAAAAQEGLAVLTEVLALASHPARLRRLAGRARAIALAEDGADFLDVYRFFRAEGDAPAEAYRQAARVFRGSLPRGAGPCTKDLAYSKGFVQVFDLLSACVRGGQARRVPLLFSGKTCLDDLPALAALADEGLLARPRRVPPPFGDLRALCAWLCVAGWVAPLA